MVKAASVPTLVAAGLSESFARFVLNGERACSMPLALWLLDEHGVRVPQLDGKSKRELETLRSVYPPAPPSPRRKRAASEITPAEALRRARAA